MKRILLLLMTLVLAALSAKAIITISPATVTVGNTSVSGYSIEGAHEGELALLLSGDNSVSVQWNGVNLNQLKSAEYIKVGTSSNPNVLGDADLMALEKLSAAKYLDIDGSTLATGANIASIKAGSAIEAVTLPDGLSKADVNAAGAALTACNSNFGSCLSLNAEMVPTQVTTYTYTDPCTSEKVDYTGTVTNGKGHIDNITRPLTPAGSSFSYINTKFRNELSYGSESEVHGDKIEPNPLKVELTKLATPKTTYQIEYNGQILTVPDYAVNKSNNTVSQEFNCAETNWQNTVGLTGKPVTVVTVEYTYTMRDWQEEKTKYYYGTAQGDETNGYYAMVENVFTGQYGYQFDVTPTYNYTYTDYINGNCVEGATISYDSPHETIDVTYNIDVDLEATTLTVYTPKEGGDCEAIAYVNKAGTLYKATSLDANDVAKVTDLVISGHINNGDISWYGADSNDIDFTDDDSFESNGATVALVNWNKAPKSVDIGDAEIDEYQHLRVLRKYGKDLKRVVLPKTATRIPNNCFASSEGDGCYNLDDVVFPTDVPFTIGDNAFKGTAIKSLLLPSGVTDVGDNAFAYCPKLTDVEMEGLNAPCHFGDNVFEQCVALKHVTLSEKVTNIGDNMFLRCKLLESIRIPTTCKTIGESAFELCSSIHQVTIPEGVELIKVNAFENAGLTDLYIMASSIDKVPKIYAMSPTGDGPSTFSYQRTTGNNTVPQYHRGDLPEADYDEVMSWYQEEQSGAEGLGTGNCLTALHYPESMKNFYEAINVFDFYEESDLASVPEAADLEDYIDYLEGNTKKKVLADLTNKLYIDNEVSSTDATTFIDEDGNPIAYEYLPQAYAVDPFNNDGSNPLMGPDKDGRYYPAQSDYVARMVAGATGVNSGGQDNTASAWGWRQFPLSSSIESIGETPFEKEYDDTWYTMAFPWRMIDNQLFSAFNQKMEIVEFVGAELLEDENSSTETVKKYNLVFHFDEVAATYYMDDNNVEYFREKDGDKVDALGHKVYVYTNKTNPNDVVRCPDEALSSSYNPKGASDAVKEAYGRYLNIQNVMVVAGHPYMIHPSIGAAPGNPATVYINGVKKIAVGEGKQYASYEALAEANKVSKTVSSRTRTKKDEDGNITYEYSGPEVWTNPDTGASGGQYYFIGNINDEVKTVDETSGKETSDHGAQDMPLPSYFLGVIEGQKYPKYYKKTKGGEGKWSQYSAIIRPDGTALANVESLYLNQVNSPTGGLAKGANIELGAWDFDDSHIINEHAITTIIEEALEKDPATPIVHMNVVYNIKGEMVRSDSSSIEGLPKGIYIVNGKKYLVK